MSLAKQQGWKGWAFDGRKNIYTSTALMDIGQEHKFQVCLFIKGRHTKIEFGSASACCDNQVQSNCRS